jgi:hypothetical protein
MKTCSIEGCGRAYLAKGLCKRHYYAEKRRDPVQAEKARAANRAWHQENKEHRRKYCEENRASRLELQRQWYQRNKEARKQHNREHYLNNKADYRAKKERRKEAERQSTPPWADISSMNRFYRECPEGHHVDHIIPLRADNVCGLHVPWNLQYLPAEENLKKGNKLREEDLRLIEAV